MKWHTSSSLIKNLLLHQNKLQLSELMIVNQRGICTKVWLESLITMQVSHLFAVEVTTLAPSSKWQQVLVGLLTNQGNKFRKWGRHNLEGEE